MRQTRRKSIKTWTSRRLVSFMPHDGNLPMCGPSPANYSQSLICLSSWLFSRTIRFQIWKTVLGIVLWLLYERHVFKLLEIYWRPLWWDQGTDSAGLDGHPGNSPPDILFIALTFYFPFTALTFATRFSIWLSKTHNSKVVGLIEFINNLNLKIWSCSAQLTILQTVFWN